MSFDLSDVVQVSTVAKELNISPAKAKTVCVAYKSEVKIGNSKFYSRTAVRAFLLADNEALLRFVGRWNEEN